MVEAAKLDGREQSAAEAARWICPHGRHAAAGCGACYQAGGGEDPELPLWDVTVWFSSAAAVPVRALKDIRRHGRGYTLGQPSTPLVYLLTGQGRAATAAEAVAGLVGFLLVNEHITAPFTVTEIRAVRPAYL